MKLTPLPPILVGNKPRGERIHRKFRVRHMSYRRGRWFVVGIFFAFMLLHQSDRLLIGTLTPDIMDSFGINMARMGAVSTGALIVGGIFYPVWGYLYDRYGRARLLALASFLWGSTTWLNALARSFGAFVVTRASTGIDDSSYPGIYSLVADYFEPRLRGRVYGLLQLSMPLGFLVGMLVALALRESIGWRGVFILTGTLGIVLSALILFGVREPPRGASEPEMAGLEPGSIYRFNLDAAKGLFRKPSLLLLFAQGFFGVFPWNVITFWFFTYLERERGYSGTGLFVTMAAAVLALAAGYPLGGALGDRLFRRTPRGRVIVAAAGVLTGALLLVVTLSIPTHQQALFLGMLMLTAVFVPFASPNVTSTVYDVTLPEVRSTALAVQYLLESTGAALAPLLAGLIADRSSLHIAILRICVSAWILCALAFIAVIIVLPRDIGVLRAQMRARAEQALASAGGEPGTAPSG